MKHTFATLFIGLFSTFPCIWAQTPQSFFPHHVGDRWDYLDYNTLQAISIRLTRDSIGTDNSHNLFYNDAAQPTYRIDTALNIFLYQRFNYLRYKLGAGSCVAWEDSGFGSIRWAWVATVDSESVLGSPTLAKDFRYAPGDPCSLGSLEEDRLAAGFGLISTQREPDYPIYLMGCVIAGDTFGFLTSVNPIAGPDIAYEYRLDQNYPNPFNGQTTITYSIPRSTFATLTIYNTLGQEIATLVSENLNPGTYTKQWNANNVASGVYYYRLTAGDFVQTKKLLLLR